MSDYVKATNFYAKDALVSGNPDKIIKGAEIDAEYNAIATSITTKANLNSPAFTGIPTAPTAAPGTSTTQVATTAFAIANGIPSGGIIMWSGSVLLVPVGFALCDGTNGTPDLRNKFIVGAGSTYAVNATGGSADAIVPSHTHTGTTNSTSLTGTFHTNAQSNIFGAVSSSGIVSSTNIVNGFMSGSGAGTANSAVDYSINATHSHAFTTNSTGVSATNANLPPYLALAYIMKL